MTYSSKDYCEINRTVLDKLIALNITDPCIQLLASEAEPSHLLLRENDIRLVAECFGKINSIIADRNTLVIRYKDLISAYFAVQVLNGKEIPEIPGRLSVKWFVLPQHRRPLAYISSKTRGKVKFICRFDIQIQNEKEFQVGRRIIGLKGSNIKKILDKCSKDTKQKVHKLIKIRLRGIGSGYKERATKGESEDPLHLYISAKQKNAFQIAVAEIEVLLKEIYAQYSMHCTLKGIIDPNLQVYRVELVSGRSQPLSPGSVRRIDESLKLSERDIQELVDKRNEARRISCFSEADAIRDLLKRKNIELIDEKGKRGRGSEVTSWICEN